ncbi:hypothetical protein EJ04DRAFT_509125 [Polyplosphaeria fusca]|uniref:tRNA (Adenosine(37)-N6)-dimethylallyltransferase MiaA n=1 Tax=Polyplosphaeria fusca TaxID=682080 RepID=A0A9P4R8C5_9PLEO|nr:hypothetical protein EJ04DRAFT_509125 [Polyplosphaeria fusca]
MSKNRIPIIAIVGPTGIGKTKLGIIAMARSFSGEVVSVDSLQVYRDAPLMTARPTPQETKGVAHHMINYLPAD